MKIGGLNEALSYLIEITSASILLAAIFTHPDQFLKVIGAGSEALVGGTQALWGPQGGKK